jgi:hypothetical protein
MVLVTHLERDWDLVLLAPSNQSKHSVQIGVWGYSESIKESSNWREFTNVLEGLEEEGEKLNQKQLHCILLHG